MKKILLSTSLLTLIASTHASQEVKHFVKCYKHFVNDIPSTTNPLLNEVKLGNTTAIDACMNLINSALLEANGEIKAGSHSNGKDETAFKVLNTFHNFHLSWFKTNNIAQSVQNGGCYKETVNITDLTESSLHITKALFNPAGKYSDIFTSTSRLMSLRYSNEPTPANTLHGTEPKDFNGFGYGTSLTPQEVNGTTKNTLKKWNPLKVQIGQLIGVKEDARTNEVPAGWYRGFGGHRPDNSAPYNTWHSTGGGAINTLGYFFLNNGKGTATYPDGASEMYRRWSQNMISEFLCRDLPVVRSEDALPHVDPAAEAPFRGGSTCMQCHSTIDQMAGVLRNNIMYPTGHVCNSDIGFQTLFAYEYPTTLSKDTVILKQHADSDFFKKPPVGRLYYRTYDGNLLDEEVDGPQGLANRISQLDDPYLCVSKKYFKHLTGIDVAIYDWTEPGATKPSVLDKEYRDFLIAIAAKAKNGTMRDMIKDIISSKYYKDDL